MELNLNIQNSNITLGFNHGKRSMINVTLYIEFQWLKPLAIFKESFK